MSGFGLGKLFGVEIRIDWSLLIIFGLILFDLGAGVFPHWHPGWSPVLTWTTALAASVLFFASVLAHELAHAVVARAQDIPVNRITLFLFGGMAHMEREPPSAASEFWMAIVGPVTSIAIGVAATLAGVWFAGVGAAPASMDQAEAFFRSLGPVETLLLWLGPINIVLGVFNLLPGFPLDGGRVFRSIVWGATGDLTKATRWASGVGQIMAWAVMGVGVINLFGGSIGQGIWLLLIGWFLNNAARASFEQLLVRQALHEVTVEQLMQRDLVRVSPDLDVERWVHDYLMTGDQQTFPVESGGQLLGLVGFDSVRNVPHSEWSRTSVRDVMTPLADLATLPPGADAENAFGALERLETDQLPVVERGHLLGLLRRSDLLKWIALQAPGPLAPSH